MFQLFCSSALSFSLAAASPLLRRPDRFIEDETGSLKKGKFSIVRRGEDDVRRSVGADGGEIRFEFGFKYLEGHQDFLNYVSKISLESISFQMRLIRKNRTEQVAIANLTSISASPFRSASRVSDDSDSHEGRRLLITLFAAVRLFRFVKRNIFQLWIFLALALLTLDESRCKRIFSEKCERNSIFLLLEMCFFPAANVLRRCRRISNICC